MNRDLSHKRENYQLLSLEDKKILINPLILFDKWYKNAENDNKILEPNCMNLATSKDYLPRTRVVLLKQYSEDGFVFYTNYNSNKGQAIAKNPHVCLNFFWPSLEKQIIIEGMAEKTSAEQSDAYFYSRPIDSQIGAIASAQSEVIENRDVLEAKVKELQNEPENIKRPEHWGGYVVKPFLYEFWQGRPNRLHDRIEYTKDANGDWQWKRLSP